MHVLNTFSWIESKGYLKRETFLQETGPEEIPKAILQGYSPLQLRLLY